MKDRQDDLSNESAMQHIHVTAMHVALIRLGGYVDLNQAITEQDWDNWHYIERGNRVEDDRVCRRGLRHLRRAVRTRLRRRHETPEREPRGPRYDASQSRDRDPAEDENAGDDNAPENMSQEEYNRRMESENPEDWPSEPQEVRRQRYLNSTLSECSDPDEWMSLHHGEPGVGLYYEGDEPNDEGEESEPTGDESPVPSEKDTVVSEFMRDEYIEWPRLYSRVGSITLNE